MKERGLIMIAETNTKREISNISASMRALMEIAVVQGTEEEWDSVLFPDNSEINAADCATINNILKAEEAGIQCIYDIYSDEEKTEDPTRIPTLMIYSPGGPEAKDKPFVLMLPGGAFVMVDILGEGLAEAREFNKQGFNVFILKYRVGNPDNLTLALDDVHRAMQVILEAGSKLGINTDRYICTGSSAGGYLAGEWSTAGKGYGRLGSPGPEAVFLAYPASSLQCYHEDIIAEYPDQGFLDIMNIYLPLILGEGYDASDAKALSLEHQIEEGFAPVYTVWNKDDPYVHERGFMGLIESLEKNGIVHDKEIYETGGHGFGPGYGIEAEGWIERAVRFWEENV